MKAESLLIITAVNIVVLIFNIYLTAQMKNFTEMGKMRTWWIFGFEWWGKYKPASMTKPDKNNEMICYKPLIFGVWIKTKGDEQ